MKTYLSVLCATLFMGFAVLSGAQAGTHAFVWDSTTGMTDIGTLGGDSSYALSINDSGVVAGYSYLSDNVTTHAFLWTATGGMVDISAGLPAGSSQASFINVRGDVAGSSLAGTQRQVPAARRGTGWRELPSLHADSRNYGFGINKLDQVTGQQYGDPNGFVHAFLWDLRTNTKVILQNHSDGVNTVGNAINDRSHVTGTGDILSSGAYQAFLWVSTTGAPMVIGQLAGNSYTAGEAINNQDEVAGINGALAGFYWNRTTGMVPLQSLGGSVSAAFGINDSGMIAGYSSGTDGISHAVRWSHYTDTPTDLGTLTPGGNSYGRGINSLGQVVGFADVP